MDMKMMEKTVKEVFYGEKYLDAFQPDEKQSLMELAAQGNYYATACLLRGMFLTERSYEETFVDEDTGEQVLVTRCDFIDGVTFEANENEVEWLTRKLYDKITTMSNRELYLMCAYLPSEIERDPFRLECVNRGEEEAAESIEDPTILRELCEKGNTYAAKELALRYHYGDEEHGIPIDLKTAEHYYRMAGETMPSPDDELEWICSGYTGYPWW